MKSTFPTMQSSSLIILKTMEEVQYSILAIRKHQGSEYQGLNSGGNAHKLYELASSVKKQQIKLSSGFIRLWWGKIWST